MNKNLPNLNAIRLFLSIVVIFFHIPRISNSFNIPTYSDLPILQKGTLAVYYFFTLSGFLIIRLLYIEIVNTKSINFKHFYIRRIQRLYPVYYLVFIIGLILYHVLLPLLGISYDYNYNINYLVLNYVLFIPNIFKHLYDVGAIFQILWSIGVEEQFYLIIPILLNLGREKILTVITCIFAFLVILLFVTPQFYKYENLYFYFIFGGLCSVFNEKNKLAILTNIYFHLFIYTLFILSFFTNLLSFGDRSLTLMVQLFISGMLFTLISYYPKFEIKSKTINYLGKISYGIYMYHMIVIIGMLFIVTKLNLQNSIGPTSFLIIFNLIAIFLTITVAHLSYKYFESLFYKTKI